MRACMRLSPASAFAVAACGIASYSVMDAVMKGMSIAHGAYSAVLWRSIAGVVLMTPIFVARRTPWPGREALKLHLARGAVAGGSVLLFFWGLVRVTLAQGVALTFLAPLIALFLAAAVLGERVRRAAIGGSIVASLGVLAIAAGQVQAQVADPLEVALFTSVVLGGLLLVGAPWFSSMPAVRFWPGIFGAAALGSFSAILLAWAYRHAEAQVLAPVEYTAFVWSVILGDWVFGEQVTAWTVGGALLIIAGCLAAVRGKPGPAPQTEAAA
jgi:S-adenosylmethionine uptake transporter